MEGTGHAAIIYSPVLEEGDPRMRRPYSIPAGKEEVRGNVEASRPGAWRSAQVMPAAPRHRA
jgi:hypothetical protein